MLNTIPESISDVTWNNVCDKVRKVLDMRNYLSKQKDGSLSLLYFNLFGATNTERDFL